MKEAAARYILGVVVLALVALSYSFMRKRGWRAILTDCVFCFSCMLGVVAGVAAAVYLLCRLK